MIGIITYTDRRNDIIDILELNRIKIEVLSLDFKSINKYSSLIILGGTDNAPLKLKPRQRLLLDKYIKSGRKVFAEYVGAIGAVSSEGHEESRFERIMDMETGKILDHQCTYRYKPFHEVLRSREPIMIFTNEHVHDKGRTDREVIESDFALFYERENVLVSSFQLANYHTSRYAPAHRFKSLVKKILEWCVDENIDVNVLTPNYYLNREKKIEEAISDAMQWLTESNVLIDNGYNGVFEGFGTEINNEGIQRKATNVRGDCVGEVGMAFYLSGLMTGNNDHSKVSENLFNFLLENLTILTGDHKGFVRWSDAAYESTYGDDVARAINPILLKGLLEGLSMDDSDVVKSVVDFMISTSGKDGLRRGRLEIEELTPEFISKLNNEEREIASVHYTGYVLATYLLAYFYYKEKKYLEIAKTGLDKLLSIYPNTLREQSQTQEEARLILPLALMVIVDKSYEEKLDLVIQDIRKRYHQRGCYLEWDEGYQAVMRNTDGTGECSLLSKNGDNVVDLLYSNNWLPLNFFVAFLATENKDYKDYYDEICKFMAEIQINSSNSTVNGAWMRGYDPELDEYFGSPADSGWGPYCIESGWTVGEIVSGLILGKIEGKLREILKK